VFAGRKAYPSERGKIVHHISDTTAMPAKAQNPTCSLLG
jgi:hypothetical protein